MGARNDQAHFGIERPIKIGGDGPRTRFVSVQGSLLTIASVFVVMFTSLSFASIPIRSLTPEASEALSAWLERPVLFLKLNDIQPDLSFAIKRSIVDLGYTPIEDSGTDDLEDLTQSIVVASSSILNAGTSTTHPATKTTENRKFITFSRDESGLAVLYEERKLVIPSPAISPENLVIALRSLVDAATSSVAPYTVFVGPEGRAALIRNYGVPYLENSKLDYLGPWLEDGKSSEGTALHTSLGKTFYLNRVVQNDRNRVVLDKTRLLCYWDGIIIYSDGYISDVSLNWRMKVSAAAPLDFLVSEGTLFLLDIAGNIYVLNLKNRRLLLSDRIEGALSISVVDKAFQVNTVHGTVVYSRDFAKKENKTLQLGEEMQLERISYFSKSTLVSPTILKLRQTAFGIFWEDVYLGQEIYLLKIEDGKAKVFTELGTWAIPLNGQSLH